MKALSIATRIDLRNLRGLICAAALWLLAISTIVSVRADDLSFATTEIDPQLQEQLDRRGELTLRETALSDALLTISEIWNVNIVVGNEVNGQVSGVFRDTTLREILAAILESNGYSYRPVGRSLVVQRESNDGAINPFFMTATIPIGFADSSELVEGAQLLASPRGRVQAVPSANSLLVFDTQQRISVIRRFVSQMDRAAREAAHGVSSTAALETAYFAPQYVDAKSLHEVVNSLISSEGRVGVMEQENRLVVLDYPSNLDRIRAAIAQLDRPRPQVRITALIYDLSLEDMERLGINWSTAAKWRTDSNGDPATLLSVDSVMQLPASAGEPTSAMTLMNLSKNIDLTGVIHALKQLTNARLLADPSVTVIDREKASIQIVTEIPYQQLTQTGNGGNIGTTAFREAGVTLNVSPKIANDGTLQLDVTPTFSRLAGFTTGSLPAPIIDKREANTTVRVVDGQTLVLGGLRQRADTRERRGVPYLKDAKHIGSLFRGRNDTVRESELVVFITPEIIMPADDRSKPREWAAQSRVRGELHRIPVAPEMVWPNVYRDCEVQGVHGQYVEPSPAMSPSPELVSPPSEVQELIVPDLAPPPAPSRPPRGNSAPLDDSARWNPGELRRMPAIDNMPRTAQRIRRLPDVEPARTEAQPDAPRGFLRTFFR